MKLAPVVLFVYNRPWHTKQTVEALQKNELANDSELFIFSDGAKNEMAVNSVQEVRSYIKTIDGFKDIEIIERDQNLGLANSVINGVTEIINKYGKIIVLEDDLIVLPYFLEFINNALVFYENDMRIFSVTGVNYLKNIPPTYNFEVYLSYRGSSWGWGTWLNRWAKADWKINDFKEFKENKIAQMLFNRAGADVTKMLFLQMNRKIDSWGIRWLYSQFKNNAFTLFPVKNLVNNIGFDGSGVHCGKYDIYETEINNNIDKIELVKDIAVSDIIVKINQAFFKRGFTKKMKQFLKIVRLLH